METVEVFVCERTNACTQWLSGEANAHQECIRDSVDGQSRLY
jgi:hypothetical protein